MGHHYVQMSNLKASRETIPLTSYLPVSQQSNSSLEIDAILRKVRESSLEMRRHENTLALAHAAKGRSMSRQETMPLERSDRSRLATNFQDLGIKNRVELKEVKTLSGEKKIMVQRGISEPKYKDKTEFLMAGETSDEDADDGLQEVEEEEDEERPTTKNSRKLRKEVATNPYQNRPSSKLEPAKQNSTGRSES